MFFRFDSQTSVSTCFVYCLFFSRHNDCICYSQIMPIQNYYLEKKTITTLIIISQCVIAPYIMIIDF